jgi:hypothetical protein
MLLSSIATSSSINPDIPKQNRLNFWWDPSKSDTYYAPYEIIENRLPGESGNLISVYPGGDASYPIQINRGATAVYGPPGKVNTWYPNGGFSYLNPSLNWTVITFQQAEIGGGCIFGDEFTQIGCFENKMGVVRLNSTQVSSGEPNDGRFHMFSVTKSGTTFKTYDNKKPEGTVTSSAGGPRNLYLFPDGFSLVGSFGPLLIYDVALTEKEIFAVYDYYKRLYILP